jgi:hypothetical protein
VRATVDRVKFYLGNYEKVLKEETVLETTRVKEKVLYEPLGVPYSQAMLYYISQVSMPHSQALKFQDSFMRQAFQTTYL